MPALNFQTQFAPKILAGQKPFTLRAPRKDGRDVMAGQTLYMFTAMRTKACRKFSEQPCRYAIAIKMGSRGVYIPNLADLKTPAQLERFSRLDGFRNFQEFCAFHKLTPGTNKVMRLVAWVTREELIKLLQINL